MSRRPDVAERPTSCRSPRTRLHTCWRTSADHLTGRRGATYSGLITYRRGKIAITNPPGLEQASCEHGVQFRDVFEESPRYRAGPAPTEGESDHNLIVEAIRSDRLTRRALCANARLRRRS